MNVAVVGCGYVGLVTGVGLAHIGHDVVAVEVDEGRRERIATGRAPFYEPGLDELLQSSLAAGRFRLAAELAEAADAEVVCLAVQTPPQAGGEIDLSYLRAAAVALARILTRDRNHVVAIRSTVVPGTATGVVAPLLDGVAAVASNPEFLAEGTAVSDFLHPDRIVVGCDDPTGRELLDELYRPLGAPIVMTSPATAELAKYTSNALLATLISFSNEIGRISESLRGVDVEDVLGIVHRDRRLTPTVDGRAVRPGILAYLRAGCGYGGSCLPKDLSALLAARGAEGFEHPLLEGVRAVNESQAERLVQSVRSGLGGLDGRQLALLGVAFKGGTDDLRESPGLAVLDLLLAAGAQVKVHDPLVAPEALAAWRARGAVWTASVREALHEAEAVVVTTNAAEFEGLEGMIDSDDDSRPLVIDGRRVLSPERIGLGRYVGVGRGPST